VESSNSGDLQSITSTRLVLLYVVKFGPVIFSYAQRRKWAEFYWYNKIWLLPRTWVRAL